MWAKSYFTDFDQISWWWLHPYQNCGHFVNRYSGIFSVSNRNLQKKETAVILKCIDHLPQNLARLHNLVCSLFTNHNNFKFFYSYCFHCFLLFLCCPSLWCTKCSEAQNVHWRKMLMPNYKLEPISLLWVKTELKNHIWNRFYGISCECLVFMDRVLEKCWYQHFEQFWAVVFQLFSRYREIFPNAIYLPSFRSIGPFEQKLQKGGGGGGGEESDPGHTNLQKVRPV